MDSLVHVSVVIDLRDDIVNHASRSVRTDRPLPVRRPATSAVVPPRPGSGQAGGSDAAAGAEGRSLPRATIQAHTAMNPIATASPPATASIT